MASYLPVSGFQLPLQRGLSRLYNDTKKSSDFVKEPVQNEDDPEVKALHRKLRIQKDRLVSWGIEWSDPNHNSEIDESISKAGLSEVVGSVMSTIKNTLDEAEPLWASSLRQVDSNRQSTDKKVPLVRWDKSRFEDLLVDLTSSIDTLYDLSRARSGGMRIGSAKSTIKSPTSEDFRPFESTRIQTPQLINRDDLTPVVPVKGASPSARSVVLMSKTAYSELAQKTGIRQPWAPLLLEYATFDSIYASTGISPPMERFEKLCAALQQDPQRSPGTWTGLPRLLGFFEDVENARFGLVYRFPASFNAMSIDRMGQRPVYSLPSLFDVLSKPEAEPPMEVKFRLAHNLVNTVFDLHARGITHGNLEARNVSFSTTATSAVNIEGAEVDIRRPLLSSFDVFPEEFAGDTGTYSQHPLDPQSKYDPPLRGNSMNARLIELYSLAIILLRIGLWTGFESLTYQASSKVISDASLAQLARRCGTLYMKAVQACAGAVDEEMSGTNSGDDLLNAVQVRTSRYLEACCILDGVGGLEDGVGQELRRAPFPAPRKGVDAKAAPTSAKEDFKNTFQKRTHAERSLEEEDLPPPFEAKPAVSASPLSGEVGTAAPRSEVKSKLFPHVPLPPDTVAQWNKTLMPEINGALRGFYKRSPESVEISLESIGPTAQTTRPTVLVVCTSVGKVRGILKKRLPGIFEGANGYGLKVTRGQVLRSRKQSRSIVRSRARRSKASSNTSKPGESDDAVNPEYQEKPNNGASIGAWIGDRHLPPVSFGGIVMVDNKPYGMTVHHMLDDPDRDFGAPENDANRSMANPISEWYSESMGSNNLEEEYAFELSDSESEVYSDTDLTSEWDDDEDYDDDDSEEPGNIPGIEPDCGDGYIVTQPALDDVEEGFFPSLETEDEDHLDTFSLGEVYASSGIRRKNAEGLVHEVDWALFRFAEERQPSDNKLPHADGDTASQQLSNSNLRPTTVASFASLPGTEVQCVARTSGLQTGKILPALTSVKIYGRTTPSHTYQVTSSSDAPRSTDGDDLPMGIPGDSGAWVVGRETGTLCGHVLAWSQRKHVAYICPMEILLRDIAETLEASHVSLPGGTFNLADAVTVVNKPQEQKQEKQADRGEPLDPRDVLAAEMAKLNEEYDESDDESADDVPRSIKQPAPAAQSETETFGAEGPASDTIAGMQPLQQEQQRQPPPLPPRNRASRRSSAASSRSARGSPRSAGPEALNRESLSMGVGVRV